MIEAMQRRLTAVLLLFLTGIYVGFCVVSYMSSAGSMERSSEVLLRRLAESKGPGEGAAPPGKDPAPPEQIGLPYFILHTDRGGSILWVERGQFDLSDETELQNMADQALAAKPEDGYLPDYGLLYCRLAAPEGWKIVFANDSVQRELRQRQIRGSVLLGLLLLPVFFVFSRGLAAFITRPVRRAWEQQTQFVADASHELKTPLTVILSNTDMILSDCPGEDLALRRRADYIREEAQRMRGLVLDMLELARSDALPAWSEQLKPLDLGGAVETAALAFDAVMYEHGLTLRTDLAEHLTVQAEEKRMGQLMGILLDNAVKYSLPGGEIRVELTREKGKSALLTISNPSEALEQDQLERLFDRFYRADEARSLQPGYGLGLAVARQIVESWSGRIWAEHREGITCFRVRLPLDRSKG